MTVGAFGSSAIGGIVIVAGVSGTFSGFRKFTPVIGTITTPTFKGEDIATFHHNTGDGRVAVQLNQGGGPGTVPQNFWTTIAVGSTDANWNGTVLTSAAAFSFDNSGSLVTWQFAVNKVLLNGVAYTLGWV